MASQKYLTKDGLEKIASYVNEKSKIVSLTKAQYDALTETQKKDEHIIYNITDMDAPGTVPIKYYENADDYYNLTDAQKEAIEELVIVNDDEGEPLSADNVSCQDAEGVLTNVQSVVDEITDDITSLNDTIKEMQKLNSVDVSYNSKIATVATSKTLVKDGNHLHMFLDFTIGDTAISAWETLLTLSNNIPSLNVVDIMMVNCVTDGTTTFIYANIKKDGVINCGYKFLATKRYYISVDAYY